MSDTNTNIFWTENLCILFTDFRVVPNKDMTKNELLNCLTRLAVIVSLILYFLDIEYWFTFLLLSIIAILLVKFYGPQKEDFTVTPTYMSADFGQTTVAPTYAEEWQVIPPSYDIYTNVSPPNDAYTFAEPLKPQSYPYGQYLTRTNLLPSDEYATHTLNGSVRNAREYVNSTFLRNDLAFRDNMTRLYKKKLARRFRNTSPYDTFSPFQSF